MQGKQYEVQEKAGRENGCDERDDNVTGACGKSVISIVTEKRFLINKNEKSSSYSWQTSTSSRQVTERSLRHILSVKKGNAFAVQKIILK